MTIIDHDQEIRDRAYFLWQRAGQPCGREHEFWAQASHDVEGDRAGQPTPERIVAR